MGIEIERRFLVDGRYDQPWRSGNHSVMCQHYLSNVIHIDGKVMWNGIQLIDEEDVLENITTWRIRLSDDGVNQLDTCTDCKCWHHVPT